MGNLKRDVWEGWTPQDFINELSDEIEMIMSGQSWMKPFKTTKELIAYVVDNQPYYKKAVPEVNDYFANRYRLEGRDYAKAY